MTDDIYPYPTDPQYHEYAWVLFNAAGTAHNIDTCSAIATHIFDHLGCGPPGTTHPPKVKYDALGGSGGPWEPGEWIDVDDDRAVIIATAPDKNITDMTDTERAELRAALDAADTAAHTTKTSDDETREG